jgi:hypothetical protein
LFPRHLRVGEAGFGIKPSGSITLARMTDIGAKQNSTRYLLNFRKALIPGQAEFN